MRRLGPGDETLLRGMNALFAEAFGAPETYAAAPPGDEYCASLLADETVILLVALDAGNIVGALGGYVLRKFEQERSELYVYDLAVAADRRREGIATALIGETRRIARAAGAWVIFVQGDRADGPALALYRKLAASEEQPHHFDITP